MLKPSKIVILLLSGIALTLIFVCPQSRSYFFELIALFQSLDIEKIKEYILSFGMLAPLISFLLMVFQAILAPLPAFLITFANAALFGWLWGAALSWVSAMVGALLCFYIAKFLGRDVVEKLTSKIALESVDAFFEKHGTYAILIARLLPFISFDVVSYAAGLTSMTLRSFLIATGVGQLPATLVYSYVGEMLSGGAATIVYGLMTLFALTLLVYLIKRVYRGR
ncbi:TVP38/TMEM64 family protein [Sulfurospirillum oryzae]|uniref:TVP38/TMEM64 family protein n=1 Tax=Sulfurospirillum oryzae TaxID=2976535 RepID=UPI0021E88E4C|nr:TVP38/TMEM64 family protein [Sulfurospirillum oryzae]